MRILNNMNSMPMKSVLCTQPKRSRNAAWYKEKAMLAEAQEARQILDEEQLAFLDNPEILIDKAQTIIPRNAAFQTEDLDTCHEKMIESQMDDIIREKLELKEQIDPLEQNPSKQIKEKESLFKTFSIFKNESKEKENKYMENEIYLEKKIKELDNIICKVGQSAQTVHMLTKPQAFYDNTYKQALELSAEQDFWFHILNPSIESSYTPPVIVEVPSELPKVSLVNTSFKKLKFHLTQFDSVVKKRITPNALKEDLEISENEDLKAQIQDKVFVITSLKNDLRKLKGKEIVDIAAQIPSANTIVPGMFKLDLEPLAPSAKKVAVTSKNNVKKVRFAVPLTFSRNIKQVKSSTTSDSNTPVLSPTGLKCSTSNCGSKPTGNKKNDRISQTSSKNIKNKVEAQPRKVNKKNRVVEPIRDVDVKHSLLKAISELICYM
ncbi:hypothetical protein Tco_1256060 [Tanacetum coccineum]